MTIKLIKRDQPPANAEQEVDSGESSASDGQSLTEDEHPRTANQNDDTAIDQTLRTVRSWVKEFRDRKSGNSAGLDALKEPAD